MKKIMTCRIAFWGILLSFGILGIPPGDGNISAQAENECVEAWCDSEDGSFQNPQNVQVRDSFPSEGFFEEGLEGWSDPGDSPYRGFQHYSRETGGSDVVVEDTGSCEGLRERYGICKNLPPPAPLVPCASGTYRNGNGQCASSADFCQSMGRSVPPHFFNLVYYSRARYGRDRQRYHASCPIFRACPIGFRTNPLSYVPESVIDALDDHAFYLVKLDYRSQGRCYARPILTCLGTEIFVRGSYSCEPVVCSSGYVARNHACVLRVVAKPKPNPSGNCHEHRRSSRDAAESGTYGGKTVYIACHDHVEDRGGGRDPDSGGGDSGDSGNGTSSGGPPGS